VTPTLSVEAFHDRVIVDGPVAAADAPVGVDGAVVSGLEVVPPRPLEVPPPLEVVHACELAVMLASADWWPPEPRAATLSVYVLQQIRPTNV
jgi:hypothetical protein